MFSHLLDNTKDRKSLELLVVRTVIHALMPMRIRKYQEKFLKLISLSECDSLEDLHSSIDKNIETLNDMLVYEHSEQVSDCRSSILGRIKTYFEQAKRYLYSLRFIDTVEGMSRL